MKTNESRILIVEDSDVAAQYAKHFLKDEGYCNVKICGKGGDAIEVFQDNPEIYSLILLDFELPDIDGLEIARHIRIIEKNLGIDEMLVPIVVTSSYVNQDQKLQFISLGITHFFKKPISENCRKAILQIIEIRDLIASKEQEDSNIARCSAHKQ